MYIIELEIKTKQLEQKKSIYEMNFKIKEIKIYKIKTIQLTQNHKIKTIQLTQNLKIKTIQLAQNLKIKTIQLA